MADEITTPASTEILTTENTSPEVSKPLNTPKPYDDDMLEAYENEATEEAAKETPEAPAAKQEKQPAKIEPEKAAETETSPSFETAALKTTINGKEVEFTGKDAIIAFQKQEEFNRNMDRRVTHISQREKAWAADQANFKSKVDKVIELTQTGSFPTVIRALAKMAAGGSTMDIPKFEKMYFDNLGKINDVYTKLTPEQRDAYFTKRALAEAQSKAQGLEDEKQFSVAQSQLQEKVVALQKEHGLDNEEFWGNYKVLAEKETGQDKAYKTPEDIKAEDVVKYALNVRHWEKVYTAAAEAGLSDEDKIDYVGNLIKSDPTLTKDDVVTLIKNSPLVKVAPGEAVENLNRKAGKNRFNQASSTKKQNDKANGLDKEDLDFLYRKQPKVYPRAR